MSQLLQTIEQTIYTLLKNSVENAIKENLLINAPMPDFIVENPANRAHGDFSSNIAMLCAKSFKMAPVKIAQIISSKIDLTGTLFEKIEVAGPGFVNFYLKEQFYPEIIREILDKKENYGRSDFGCNKKVMVEFVSANPTGPMHMGNARGGALGDCLAAVLEIAGYDVHREFYVNDAGNQINKFGISLDVRYQQIFHGKDAIALPEDAYQGADIMDLAKEFALLNGDVFLKADETTRRKALVEFALPKNIKKMKSDLEKYRINFDNWFHESELHKNGEITEVIDILKSKNLTYEKDDAIWYKATELGFEKDEVLVRSNGTPTYFAADIAYHRNKFAKRNFELCIDLWGADHHGHVARMKSSMDAIGLDGAKLDVLLFQLVRLVKNGEVVKMSKRTGRAIQLADLLDEVPVDAARFIFNVREANSQMDFDLDLAVKQDAQNPVYYVQYAHARICSIIKNLEALGVCLKDCETADFLALNSPEEKELIWHLSKYTGEIIDAAKNYEPAKITRYVVDLATLFHKFYNAHKVNCDNENLRCARLALCVCVKTVIKNILTMFKITVPEAM